MTTILLVCFEAVIIMTEQFVTIKKIKKMFCYASAMWLQNHRTFPSFFCSIKIKTSLQLTLEWNSEKWMRQQMKNNWVIFPKLNLQKLVIVVNSLQFCGFIPWWYDVVKQQHNVLVHKFYALWALQTIRTVYFPKR